MLEAALISEIVSPGQRIEVVADRAQPEIRIVNNIVTYVAGHIELEELSLAAGFFEGRKVFPAMGNRIK
jgi:hypothetical protein